MKKQIELSRIVVYLGVITTYSLAKTLAEINGDFDPDIRKATAKECHKYRNRP